MMKYNRVYPLWGALILLLFGVQTLTAATVSTDQSDYAPGSTVTIAGTGFQANELVQLVVTNLTNPADPHTGQPWATNADLTGKFTATWLVTTNELGATLLLTARGLSSGQVAQEMFADSSSMIVSGTVQLASGTGISGATVTAYTSSALTTVDTSQGAGTTTSAADGTWSLTLTKGTTRWVVVTTPTGYNSISAVLGTGSPSPSGVVSSSEIEVSSGSSGGTVSGNTFVMVAAATRLVITLPGQTFASGSGNSGTISAQTAGSSFNLKLSAVDSGNNIDTTYSGSKTVSYSGPVNSPSGTTPIYTTTVTFVSGQATGVATTLVKAESATITASISGLTGVASSSLTVNAGPASKLAYTTVPGTGTAGTAFSATVQSQDTYGNPSSPTSSTTITLSKATGAGTMRGTLTGIILTSGNSVTIATPVYSKSDAMTLTAAATAGMTSLTLVTSGSIVFSAGVATQLVFTSLPVTVSAGVASGTITVQRQDLDGNPNSTDANRTVTLASTSSGTVTFNPTSLTLTSGSSAATFTYTDTKAGSPTITAASTSPGTITAATQVETVNAATANHLVFSTSPAGAVYKTAFITQPVVKTQDSYGNLSTVGLGSTVTVNLSLSTGSGPLVGTTSLNLGTAGGNGTATFSGLQINKSENGDVLAAAATGFTGGTASPLDVVPATVTPTVTLNNKVYDGTTAATTFASRSLSGILGGDDVSLGTSGSVAVFSSKNVGSYTPGVTGLSLSGTTAGNYQLSTTSASPGANITAAALSVTANNDSKTYGQTRIYGAGSTNFTSNGLQNGETIGSVTLVAVGGTNTTAAVGTYPIAPSAATAGTFLSGNYTISYTNGILTVNPASPVVTVASALNPAGYKAAVSFNVTLPTDASGSVVFLAGSAPFSTNALAAGTATSLTITNLPRGTNSISVQYAGDGNYLGSTNSLAVGQIVTNHPPVAGNVILTRSLSSMRILISTLGTNVSDVDGDALTFSAGSTSTNGVAVLNATSLLGYYNTNTVNDQFTYTVTDGFGGSVTGTITLNFTAFITGQQGSVSVSAGVAHLAFLGIPNFRYAIERTTNLVDWVSIAITNAPSAGAFKYADNFSDLGGTTPSSAYYRLHWNP